MPSRPETRRAPAPPRPFVHPDADRTAPTHPTARPHQVLAWRAEDPKAEPIAIGSGTVRRDQQPVSLFPEERTTIVCGGDSMGIQGRRSKSRNR